MNKTAKIWRNWLMLLAGGTILLGLAMVFFPQMVIFSPFIQSAAQGLTQSEVFSGPGADIMAFGFGLAGAATMGWGIMMFFIARGPFARGESWAWWCFATSAGIWCVVDTLHVMAAGAHLFALLNLAMALAVAVPLLATFRVFFGSGSKMSPRNPSDEFK